MAIKVKPKVIKVSIKKIKRIAAGKLASAANRMIMSISGDTDVFKGEQPCLPKQVKLLIKAFVDAQSFYELNGLMGKKAYTDAKDNLINCMLTFAPYVDGIAKGDKKILKASTLPTTEALIDVEKLIKSGVTASGISGKQGKKGQLFTVCKPFGDGVNYIAVLSEDFPLVDGFCINSSGQIVYPAGMTNRVFIDITTTRKKVFEGLDRFKIYYINYILVFGDVVSLISEGKKVSCGS